MSFDQLIFTIDIHTWYINNQDCFKKPECFLTFLEQRMRNAVIIWKISSLRFFSICSEIVKSSFGLPSIIWCFKINHVCNQTSISEIIHRLLPLCHHESKFILQRNWKKLPCLVVVTAVEFGVVSRTKIANNMV
jgi:hypothetical protein